MAADVLRKMVTQVVFDMVVRTEKVREGFRKTEHEVKEFEKQTDESVKKVRANIKKLKDSLSEPRDETKKLRRALFELGRESVRIGDSLIRAGSTMAVFLTAPMIAASAAAVKFAIDFEHAFAEVRTIADAMPSEFEQIADQLRAISTTVPQTLQELTQGLYQTISAGITNTAEALHVLDVAAKAAIAGVTDTATAVDALTTVLNAYQMSAGEAERVSDVLFTTVKLGKITFEPLAHALGKFISTAATAKVPLEEVAAAMAVLTKNGVRADIAAISLNQAMLAFIKPSKEAKEAADKYGISLEASTLQTYGLLGAVRQLSQLMQAIEADGGNAVEVLGEIITNVRSLRAMATLANAGLEDFADTVATMEDPLQATQEAFEVMAADTMNQFKVAMQSLQNVMIEFGNHVVPIVKVVVNLVKGVIAGIEKLGGFGRIVGFATVALTSLSTILILVVGFSKRLTGALMTLYASTLTTSEGFKKLGFVALVSGVKGAEGARIWQAAWWRARMEMIKAQWATTGLIVKATSLLFVINIAAGVVGVIATLVGSFAALAGARKANIDVAEQERRITAKLRSEREQEANQLRGNLDLYRKLETNLRYLRDAYEGVSEDQLPILKRRYDELTDQLQAVVDRTDEAFSDEAAEAIKEGIGSALEFTAGRAKELAKEIKDTHRALADLIIVGKQEGLEDLGDQMDTVSEEMLTTMEETADLGGVLWARLKKKAEDYFAALAPREDPSEGGALRYHAQTLARQEGKALLGFVKKAQMLGASVTELRLALRGEMSAVGELLKRGDKSGGKLLGVLEEISGFMDKSFSASVRKAKAEEEELILANAKLGREVAELERKLIDTSEEQLFARSIIKSQIDMRYEEINQNKDTLKQQRLILAEHEKEEKLYEAVIGRAREMFRVSQNRAELYEEISDLIGSTDEESEQSAKEQEKTAQKMQEVYDEAYDKGLSGIRKMRAEYERLGDQLTELRAKGKVPGGDIEATKLQAKFDRLGEELKDEELKAERKRYAAQFKATREGGNLLISIIENQQKRIGENRDAFTEEEETQWEELARDKEDIQRKMEIEDIYKAQLKLRERLDEASAEDRLQILKEYHRKTYERNKKNLEKRFGDSNQYRFKLLELQEKTVDDLIRVQREHAEQVGGTDLYQKQVMMKGLRELLQSLKDSEKYADRTLDAIRRKITSLGQDLKEAKEDYDWDALFTAPETEIKAQLDRLRDEYQALSQERKRLAKSTAEDLQMTEGELAARMRDLVDKQERVGKKATNLLKEQQRELYNFTNRILSSVTRAITSVLETLWNKQQQMTENELNLTLLSLDEQEEALRESYQGREIDYREYQLRLNSIDEQRASAYARFQEQNLAVTERVWRAIVDAVLSELARLAASWLVTTMLKLLFPQFFAGFSPFGTMGGSGLIKSITPGVEGGTYVQHGGLIEGGGTSTSDSILAHLSRGEYVVNAASTKLFLPLLESINAITSGTAAKDYMMGGLPTAGGGALAVELRDMTNVLRDIQRQGGDISINVHNTVDERGIHSMVQRQDRQQRARRLG